MKYVAYTFKYKEKNKGDPDDYRQNPLCIALSDT